MFRQYVKLRQECSKATDSIRISLIIIKNYSVNHSENEVTAEGYLNVKKTVTNSNDEVIERHYAFSGVLIGTMKKLSLECKHLQLK